MAVVVVLDFFLFIVPMIAYLVLGVINKPSITTVITPFFGTLAVTHTVVNVFIYGTQDAEMRKTYAKLICPRVSKPKPSLTRFTRVVTVLPVVSALENLKNT